MTTKRWTSPGNEGGRACRARACGIATPESPKVKISTFVGNAFADAVAKTDVDAVLATLGTPLKYGGLRSPIPRARRSSRRPASSPSTLNVVAIFGKFKDGETTGDVGIDGFNEFVADMKQELGSHSLVTVPASVPANPGVKAPDIEFTATLAGGKTVHVVALLTDNVDRAYRTRSSAPATRACRRAPTSSSTPGTPASARTSARSRTRASGSPASTSSSTSTAATATRTSTTRCRTRTRPSTPTTRPATSTRHRCQRHAGVLRVDVRRDDGDVPRPDGLRRAADLRADLPAKSCSSPARPTTRSRPVAAAPSRRGAGSPITGRSARGDEEVHDADRRRRHLPVRHDRHRRRRPLRPHRQRADDHEVRLPPLQDRHERELPGHARRAVDDQRDGARLRLAARRRSTSSARSCE